MCSHGGDFAGICDQYGDFGHMTRPMPRMPVAQKKRSCRGEIGYCCPS